MPRRRQGARMLRLSAGTACARAASSHVDLISSVISASHCARPSPARPHARPARSESGGAARRPSRRWLGAAARAAAGRRHRRRTVRRCWAAPARPLPGAAGDRPGLCGRAVRRPLRRRHALRHAVRRSRPRVRARRLLPAGRRRAARRPLRGHKAAAALGGCPAPVAAADAALLPAGSAISLEIELRSIKYSLFGEKMRNASSTYWFNPERLTLASAPDGRGHASSRTPFLPKDNPFAISPSEISIISNPSGLLKPLLSGQLPRQSLHRRRPGENTLVPSERPYFLPFSLLARRALRARRPLLRRVLRLWPRRRRLLVGLGPVRVLAAHVRKEEVVEPLHFFDVRLLVRLELEAHAVVRHLEDELAVAVPVPASPRPPAAACSACGWRWPSPPWRSRNSPSARVCAGGWRRVWRAVANRS